MKAQKKARAAKTARAGKTGRGAKSSAGKTTAKGKQGATAKAQAAKAQAAKAPPKKLTADELAAAKKEGLTPAEASAAKGAGMSMKQMAAMKKKGLNKDEAVAAHKAGLSPKDAKEAKDAGLKPKDYKGFADAKKANPKLTAKEYKKKLDDAARKKKGEGQDQGSGIGGQLFGGLGNLGGALAGLAGAAMQSLGQLAAAAGQIGAALIGAAGEVLSALVSGLADVLSSLFNMIAAFAPQGGDGGESSPFLDKKGKMLPCPEICAKIGGKELTADERVARDTLFETMLMNNFGGNIIVARKKVNETLDPDQQAILCKEYEDVCKGKCTPDCIVKGTNKKLGDIHRVTHLNEKLFFAFLSAWLTAATRCKAGECAKVAAEAA
jgi:hypothetical protein